MKKNLKSTMTLTALLGALVLSVGAISIAAEWKPADGILLSKFAKDVDPANPLPEYPRPQLVRDEWVNLNGLWDYAVVPTSSLTDVTADLAFGQAEKSGKILVPFPFESALSGVTGKVGSENYLLYRRYFTVPENWAGKRILLHFDAVDWRATVKVNGKVIGTHQGGYAPFSFDVTDALTEVGEQRLELIVWDPTDESGAPQPRGKQVCKPGGIWYTSVTGIWQPVWMEPVADAYIAKIKPVSDIKAKTMTFNVKVGGEAIGTKVRIAGQEVAVAEGSASITVAYPNAELWSPENPKLYDFTAELVRGYDVIDSVKSYFGMREISLGKTKDGITRVLLNGEFVFQHGPLDQGWWPDGLYRAPTDEALRFDVEMTKAFGFNMLRKHVKSESSRFYYHCDQIGILVWQDMPSGDGYIGTEDPDFLRSSESCAIYEQEYAEMIRYLDSFPSIIMWVPFNEGWGQFDTARIVELTKQLDPTRLVNCASGWTDRNCGSVHDMHNYPGPGMPEPEEARAVVLGEYGGLGLPIKGHSWKEDGNWGFDFFNDQETLFQKYDDLNKGIQPLIDKGLSAAVYTQTTDCEIEVNGLMSYDREVIKVPVDKMFESNKALE